MPKLDEASLKDDLVAVLRDALPGARRTILRHEDKNTAGIPDISVTWRRRTSWWEVKYANPSVESRGVQDFTLQALAANGFARHIVYAQEKVFGIPAKAVYIVKPEDIADWREKHERRIFGFDHKRVASHIIGVHLL